MNNTKPLIAFKKSFYDLKFDGIYGFFITLKNIITLQFNSICHVELVFSENYGNISFSSVEGEGSRFKEILYSHPERWIFLEWDISNSEFKQYKNEQELYDFCRKLEGRPYDWEGIVGQATIPTIQNPILFFCSEIIARIMRVEPEQITPAILFKKLRDEKLQVKNAKNFQL